MTEAKQPEEVVKEFVGHKNPLLSSLCLSSSSRNSQRRLYGFMDGGKASGSGHDNFQLPDSNIPFFFTVSSASAAA